MSEIFQIFAMLLITITWGSAFSERCKKDFKTQYWEQKWAERLGINKND